MIIEGQSFRSVWLANGVIHVIDQSQLPEHFKILQLHTPEEVAAAITSMAVRGAPAIGALAAYGLALGIQQLETDNLQEIEQLADVLRGTRPTAHDLDHGLQYVLKSIAIEDSWKNRQAGAFIAAEEYAQRSITACRQIGGHGRILIHEGDTVLTHCNAGALATVDYGTALGVLRAAHARKINFHVYVPETRPRLQGTRLTAWELQQEGIPCTVIADHAAGYFMQRGEVNLVITGADRVARNGDAANKIGTYEKAVLAKAHGIPFYIAAPVSTIDFECSTGDEIPIEERDNTEVLNCGGCRVAAPGSQARNPAFDVTPARYIKGIITEQGIFPPGKIVTLAA